MNTRVYDYTQVFRVFLSKSQFYHSFWKYVFALVESFPEVRLQLISSQDILLKIYA